VQSNLAHFHGMFLDEQRTVNEQFCQICLWPFRDSPSSLMRALSFWFPPQKSASIYLLAHTVNATRLVHLIFFHFITIFDAEYKSQRFSIFRFKGSSSGSVSASGSVLILRNTNTKYACLSGTDYLFSISTAVSIPTSCLLYPHLFVL
jgi:hypothetical protein